VARKAAARHFFFRRRVARASHGFVAPLGAGPVSLEIGVQADGPGLDACVVDVGVQTQVEDLQEIG